jgi:hypothetical protein
MAASQYPDVAKFDLVVDLALKSDDTGLAPRVLSVEQGLSIENDHVLIAPSGDVVIVLLARKNRRGQSFHSSDQAAGVVSGRLIVPDLKFVASYMRLALLLRPEKHAAVYLFRAAELKL